MFVNKIISLNKVSFTKMYNTLLCYCWTTTIQYPFLLNSFSTIKNSKCERLTINTSDSDSSTQISKGLFSKKENFTVNTFRVFLGAELLYESLFLYVCMYVCWYVMYVCLSVCHTFLKPYILQLIHFTDILIKYKIF